MNEKDFQKQLDTIALEDTPENMNIWENIKMELVEDKPKKQKRAPSRYPWLRAAAAFITILGLGIAGYIYYKAQFPEYSSYIGDPSLPEALVSQLGLSQTVEGVTITIDWAYADAHRAALGMTTSYMSDIAFDPYCATCIVSTVLQTVDGQVLPPAFGGGGGGGGGGPIQEPYLISMSSGGSYDSSGLQITGDTIDLVLIISYDPLGQIDMQANGSGNGGTGGSGGGGGGGGGGSSDNMQLMPSPTMDSALMPVRTYRFEFSIPFYPAQAALSEGSILRANDVSFDLSNVSVSPSMLFFDLCYSLPTAEDWYPKVFVYTGVEMDASEYMSLVDLQGRSVYSAHNIFNASSETVMRFDYESYWACGSFMVQAPYEGGDIEISIPYLYKGNEFPDSIEESDLMAEQEYFSEQGIEFIYSLVVEPLESKGGQDGTLMYPASQNPEDGYYIVVITEHPESMTANEALQYLMDNWMRERHEVGISYPVQLED